MRTLFWRFRFAFKMMRLYAFNAKPTSNFSIGWTISEDALQRFGLQCNPSMACFILVSEWYEK